MSSYRDQSKPYVKVVGQLDYTRYHISGSDLKLFSRSSKHGELGGTEQWRPFDVNYELPSDALISTVVIKDCNTMGIWGTVRREQVTRMEHMALRIDSDGLTDHYNY